MEKSNYPLVSVPVVTYNSSKTVIETLDSIYNQTYPNIELIISDDCSTDNTVEICREWLDLHKARFVRTEMLTVEKNTGLSANCNRVSLACHGKWEKGIAGDDIMLPNCIQDNIDYVNKHPDAIIVFSKVECFGVDLEMVSKINQRQRYDFWLWTKEQQLEYLYCVESPINANTAFSNREKILKIGIKNDERIPNCEDWPKWINYYEKGINLDFLDKVTVKYRISENSLSTRRVFSNSFNQSLESMFILYQFPYLWRTGRKTYAIRRYIQLKKSKNKKLFWKILNSISKLIFGPVSAWVPGYVIPQTK